MIIAFTVHNRADYLRDTLESWSRVRGIERHHLFFSCEPGFPESAEVAKSVDFAPSTTYVRGARQGVLANPRAAFASAFNRRDCGNFAVLAEEDMVVSPDVLEYFAWCQRYGPDATVLGVTTYQHHKQRGGLAGVGTADWSRDNQWHFWVWGTWFDRWVRLLKWNWDTTYEENGGGPMQRGWDWKFRNTLVIGKGMRMIAPAMCRSQHIGRLGGAHCTPDQFDGLLSKCFAGADVPPQNYREVTW